MSTIFFFPDRTVVAVAGEDFSVIASDTRLSEGFSIHSRDQSKSYQLTKTTVLGACGFHGDVLTLTKLLKARLKVKEPQHEISNNVTLYGMCNQSDRSLC